MTEIIPGTHARLSYWRGGITHLFPGNLSIATVDPTVGAAVPAEFGVLSSPTGSALWYSVSLATVALLAWVQDGVAADLVLTRAAATVSGHRVAIIALLPEINLVIAAVAGLTVSLVATVPAHGTYSVTTPFEHGSVQACGRGRSHDGDEQEQRHAAARRKEFVWMFHAISS
jgi:hypothetical protein